MIPQQFRIQKLKSETYDTFTMELVSEKKKDGFSFLPGQFNMLYVFGVGEVPISISGDPTKQENLMHTIRDVGSVTGALRKLEEGDSVGVRGPFGSAWPVEAAEGKDVVIVTGGIGLAPLRPAFYHILANRKKYGKVAILYGARTPEDILYPEDLQEWRSKFDLQVRVTVDRAGKDWHGTVGVVPSLISKVRFDPKNTLAMVCGPEIMMRFTVQELEKCGLMTEQIYVSMERNMKCAIGFCGHCQYGPKFICKDGPVFRFDEIEELFAVREV